MSFLKLIKLAKEFEGKLRREGQQMRLVQPGGGGWQNVDLSKVQVPAPPAHEKWMDVPPPPPEQPQEMRMPEAHITGRRPANPNVLKVQNFLNQELAVKTQTISPITPNGRWNQETANALKKWLAMNNLGMLDMNKGFTAALARATGAGVAQQISQVPTPNLDAARKS